MRVRTWITTEPLEPGALLDGIATPDDGAVVLFLGRVRRQNDGREVHGLRYDAYREMAEREFAEIAAEAAGRWPVSRLVAAHRIGNLGLGEVSVVVVAASEHRADAFAGARHVIEQVKIRLPIWKQEHYAGESRWLDGTPPPVPEPSID